MHTNKFQLCVSLTFLVILFKSCASDHRKCQQMVPIENHGTPIGYCCMFEPKKPYPQQNLNSKELLELINTYNTTPAANVAGRNTNLQDIIFYPKENGSDSEKCDLNKTTKSEDDKRNGTIPGVVKNGTKPDIGNRHALDVPNGSTCPPGQEYDMTGQNCVTPF